MSATRCIGRIVGWGGRVRRCPRDATTERAGRPVCTDHQEPRSEKS